MKKRKFGIVPQAKVINIVVAGLVFAAGLFFLLFPEEGRVARRYVLGVMCLIIGCAKMLGYFSNDMYRLAFQFDFAMGAFMAIIGGIILGVTAPAERLVPVLLGIYLILDAAQKVQIALDARRFGIEKWLLILITASVLTAVCVAAAVCVFYEFANVQTVLAVALMADGCENAWITAYTVRVRATKKNLLDLLEEDKHE
ncbi:MAG: DUF308 domain-containing protein [Oscillospiraceae bacterium]|nr:DUF308 domain-containing protein [Oscillospiraceae bacterium]